MAKILVAEDDPHIGKVINLWLTRQGHQVVVASTGLRALEVMRGFRPDMVVTDMNLPGMSGLELLEAARRESLLVRSPIVLTSRCDQREISAAAASLGAIVHPKPFSPTHLGDTIRSILEVPAHLLDSACEIGDTRG